MTECRRDRRGFLLTAACGLFATETLMTAFTRALARPRWPVIRQVRAGVLDVGYYELGPPEGPAVLLLHGFPYAADGFAEVAPMLAASGCRVVVPHLRGHATTRFLDAGTPRSGQQSALGADLVALLDALGIERAVLAGYDWGGRAACVVAALWPERCAGLVSVNGYLIQDIARADQPLPPATESGLWYQFYFLTERGRAGLAANRRDLARVLWRRNSPTWRFDEATFARSAAAFDNPDYVDVVIHSYRHRLGAAPGHREYAELERRLATLPPIAVPTITVDGADDGVVPPTDGQAAATRFTGPHEHRVMAGVGHNPPQEEPVGFARVVWDLVTRTR